MIRWIRQLAVTAVVSGLAASFGTGSALAAAGSPPLGPIDPVETGSDLKFACGQHVEGFKDVVGEEFLRWMLIVQCRAFVGGVVELIQTGQVVIEDSPRWQCVTIPEDVDELSATFVTWVGRRPALMREPAAIALVEAVELSAPCRDG